MAQYAVSRIRADATPWGSPPRMPTANSMPWWRGLIGIPRSSAYGQVSLLRTKETCKVCGQINNGV